MCALVECIQIIYLQLKIYIKQIRIYKTKETERTHLNRRGTLLMVGDIESVNKYRIERYLGLYKLNFVFIRLHWQSMVQCHQLIASKRQWRQQRLFCILLDTGKDDAQSSIPLRLRHSTNTCIQIQALIRYLQRHFTVTKYFLTSFKRSLTVI